MAFVTRRDLTVRSMAMGGAIVAQAMGDGPHKRPRMHGAAAAGYAPRPGPATQFVWQIHAPPAGAPAARGRI